MQSQGGGKEGGGEDIIKEGGGDISQLLHQPHLQRLDRTCLRVILTDIRKYEVSLPNKSKPISQQTAGRRTIFLWKRFSD